MKSSIRKMINEKLEGKVESQNIILTPEALKELMASVLAEARKLNPIEQKKFDEEMQREERRRMLMVELGKAEESADRRRKGGCSHSRDARTGNATARGTGEWTTGGQLHTDGTITLICLRCANPWHWMATPEEREYANNAGLLGMTPPPDSRLMVA